MTGTYDLIVLDLLLPALDGTAVLAQLTEARPDQAVLVLSAVSGVDPRVRCLRLGAADYLVKPFAIDELVARVHAVLRARGRSVAADVRRLGGTLDRRTRHAEAGDGPVHLSEKEYLLLAHLMDRSPDVCLREEPWQMSGGSRSGRGATSSTCASGGSGRSLAVAPSRRCEMSDIVTWARKYRLEVAWGGLSAANLVAMLVVPHWATVPFHLVWVSLTLLYGLHVWTIRITSIVLAVVGSLPA